MRLEDFIHVEKNAISDELCKQIIKEYDDLDDWDKMFDYDPYFNRVPPGFENK